MFIWALLLLAADAERLESSRVAFCRCMLYEELLAAWDDLLPCVEID